MKRAGILRHGALDLLSASAFLGIWLLRDRFEYDTLRALLLWPLVFELYLTVALFLAAMSAEVRSGLVRWAWCGLLAGAYLFAAWLTVANAGLPKAWSIALWLLLSRVLPPRSFALLGREHLNWLMVGAGDTGLLWGAGFILMMVLVMVVPSQATQDVDGSLHGTSPTWIFPLVWTPYFVAEAMIRSWRQARSG
jgi:hypothetical protein